MKTQEIITAIETYATEYKKAQTRKETDKIDADVEEMLESEVEDPIKRSKYQIRYYAKTNQI